MSKRKHGQQFDIKESSSSSVQQVGRTRMKDHSSTDKTKRKLQASRTSNLSNFQFDLLFYRVPPPPSKNRCQLQGPVARYFCFIWSYGHHAEIPDMIPKMASPGKSFIGLPSPFPIKSISDHLQYQKHSASKLQ